MCARALIASAGAMHDTQNHRNVIMCFSYHAEPQYWKICMIQLHVPRHWMSAIVFYQVRSTRKAAVRALQAYYGNRSQPPLLAAMVDIVRLHPAAQPLPPDLLPRCIQCLTKEHAYWTKPPKQILIHDSKKRAFALSRYCAAWHEPRPESFRCAAATARKVQAVIPVYFRVQQCLPGAV